MSSHTLVSKRTRARAPISRYSGKKAESPKKVLSKIAISARIIRDPREHIIRRETKGIAGAKRWLDPATNSRRPFNQIKVVRERKHKA